MNISEKIYLAYGFWEEYFWIFFKQVNILVTMETNQIQQIGQNSYVT